MKVNKIERLKAQKQPFDYRSELPKADWHALDEEARFYLKNFGIYNIKLRPEVFMIRLRIDGGRISAERLEQIVGIIEAYGLKVIVTSRAQLELHEISASDVYAVYEALQHLNIETAQTLTDNFRAIVTDPYDGEAEESHVTCYPLIEEIRERILNNPSWMGTLPRKFNTALIGRKKPLLNPWGNDLLFALATKEGAYGFNVYLGGKNSEVAKTANIFVLPEVVPELFEAVVQTYHEHGLRGSRSKTRLFHLIAQAGMGQVRVWIEHCYGSSLAGEGALEMVSAEYLSETPLKSAAFGSIFRTRYGESSAEALREVLSLAKASRAEIRLGADQNFHLLPSEASLRLPTEEGTLLTACAGSRYCPLSLWDIKADADALPLGLFRKHKISLGFSGCLKGCGRHYHSDIGLIGLRTNLYGETEKAFRIFLGATQSPVARPSRMLYYSVPLRASDRLFRVLFEDFEESGLASFELFSHQVLNRYEIDLLQLWYLFRQLYETESRLLLGRFLDTSAKAQSHALFEEIKGITAQKEVSEPAELTRILSYRLWDQDVL